MYWLNEIEDFIKKDIVQCYAEDALNKITDKVILFPAYYDKEFCIEIDNKDDLNRANSLIENLKT